MPERTIKLLGARVRQLREALDLEAGQLAYKAGIHRATVYRVEDGDRPNTSAIVVARIADVLNTSTDYLLGRTDDPAPLANPAGASLQARAYAREILDIYVELERYAPELLPLATNTLATQAELLRVAREAERKQERVSQEEPANESA